MEQALRDIDQELTSLTMKNRWENKYIFKDILGILIHKMIDNDPLFKYLFTEDIFFGGSFYDGLRISDPDEFDLDLFLNFPYAKLLYSKVPGHVKVKLDARRINKYNVQFVDSQGFVLPFEILKWFKSVVYKAIPASSMSMYNRETCEEYKLYIKHNCERAQSLEFTCASFSININLVPGIQFEDEDNGQMLAVPMSPEKRIKSLKRYYGTYNKSKSIKIDEELELFNRHFRLSYHMQEHFILKGKNSLKPSLRLLKLIRRVYDHRQIACYYLKTLMLNLIDTKPDDFWDRPLSCVFLDVLKEYIDVLSHGTLLYYWDESYNLLENIKQPQLKSIANNIRQLSNILEHSSEPEDIDSYFEMD